MASLVHRNVPCWFDTPHRPKPPNARGIRWHDGNVSFDHAEFLAQGVPGARMIVAESCGHLICMSEEERKIRDAVIEFVEEHTLA